MVDKPQGGVDLEVIIYHNDNLQINCPNVEKSVIDSEEKLESIFNGGNFNEVLYVNSRLKGHNALFNRADKVFLPIEYYLEHLSLTDTPESNTFIILDLKHIPSSAKLLEQLEKTGKNRNGVFRLRRGSNSPEIYKKSVGDILVLSKLFGEPRNLFQKGVHDQATDVGHLIISVRFDNNVMAHLEYSAMNTEKELLEMEMSVPDTIVEFSSDRKGLTYLTSREKESLLLDVQSMLRNPLKINSKIHSRISGIVNEIPLLARGEK
jgi:hypothetical protein